jgi:hypothetical protein
MYARRLLVDYGITPDDYERMRREQNDLCKICKRPSEERKFNVDHDHKTGKVRGLLCAACNRGIGFLQDSADIALSAAKYLMDYEDRPT